MADVIATEKGYFGGEIREVGARFVVPDDLWRDKKRRPKWARLDPAHAFGGKGDHDGDGDVGGSVPAADEPVAVSEDWRGLHHNKRKAIAKQIAGKAVSETDEADRIIAAYLESQKPAEPAGNGLQEALGGVAPDWLPPGASA